MRKWKDTIENGTLFAELDGSRQRARVQVLPITYGRKHVRSGHPFHHGESYGIVGSFIEAKTIVEKIDEIKRQRT